MLHLLGTLCSFNFESIVCLPMSCRVLADTSWVLRQLFVPLCRYILKDLHREIHFVEVSNHYREIQIINASASPYLGTLCRCYTVVFGCQTQDIQPTESRMTNRFVYEIGHHHSMMLSMCPRNSKYPTLEFNQRE
jgi:hypothetical protein